MNTQKPRQSAAGQERGYLLLAIVCLVFASVAIIRSYLSFHSGFGIYLAPALIAAGSLSVGVFYFPEAYRFFCFNSSGLGFVVPVVVYYFYIGWIGFPDGSRTQFDRTVEALFPFFFGISYALGGVHLYLGWVGRREKHHRRFKIALFSLVLFYAITILTEYSLLFFLDDGAGG